jgi:hypothetical protein
MVEHARSEVKVQETKRGASCRIRKLVSPPHDAKPHRFLFGHLRGFHADVRIRTSFDPSFFFESL